MACINIHMQNVIGSCLSAAITRVGSEIKAEVKDAVEKHLKVRTNIVCSLSEVIDFLKVTPTEIQWITDDMGVFFDVESNVDWIIVIS